MTPSEVRAFYDTDADPRRLDGRVIAIIGYGSQARAPLNLRDAARRAW